MRAASVFFVLGLISCAGAPAAPPPDPHFKLVLRAPPATAVDTVAVSRDGSIVSTAAGEGGVRMYDAWTGTLLRVIGETAGDRCVVFSPDGRTLAAAGFHMDKLASLWDVASGKRLHTFAGHTEWETDATAVSPDGKLLASSGTDKQVLVWETATGKLRLRLKDQPFRVSALAFSPDGTTLAGGGGDKCVRLWHVTGGQLRRTLSGHADWVCTVAFSPDGKTLAAGSCDWGFHRGHDWPRPADRGAERCEWRLWDVASGELRRKVSDAGRMLSLAFAPDGRSLACGIGKEVRLYDLASEAPGRVITAHDADVTSVAFTPDGAAVVSASHDQTVQRTRLADGTVEWHAPGYFEQVNSVALSDDASILVTGGSDHRFMRGRLAAGAAPIGPGAVRLWDIRAGRLLRRLGDPAEQVMAVAVSPDGRRVAAGGALAGGKGFVHVWDAAGGTPLWSTDERPKEVLALAFSRDGASLAAGGADDAVRILDVGSGRVLQNLTGHKGGATAVAFSPDGSALYCAEAHGGARAWDARSGRLLTTYKARGRAAETFTVDRLVQSIGLSRDGRTLATCASSTNDEFVDPVRIWDASTGALRRDFAGENIAGRPIALSPDGTMVATGGKSVKLWDAQTGMLVRELYGRLKRTQSIAFSSDGRLLVAGGSYGTTNLWEVSTGRQLATLFAFTRVENGSAADDWLACHPEGFYDGSPGAERYLAWRVGDELQTPRTLGAELHRPERVTESLGLGDASATRR